MASGSISFPEWLNANSLRAYPLGEDASQKSDSGEVFLPNPLIVDARINAPHAFAAGTFFVSAAESTPDRVKLTLSYHDGANSSVVAAVAAEVSTHERNQAYPFVGVGDNHAVMGSIVLGELEDAISRLQGSFTFSHESTPFEIGAINLSQPMIEYVSLTSDGTEIAKLERIVKLTSGPNIRLTRVDAETVRIDGIPGENLDDCPEEPTAPPIRTINGAPPDSEGNLLLVGSECISVVAKGANTLEIRDLCSSSCCGCRELQTLLSSLEAVEEQQADLRELVYRAYQEQSSMIANLTAYLRP